MDEMGSFIPTSLASMSPGWCTLEIRLWPWLNCLRPDVFLALDNLTVHPRVDGRHAVEPLQKLDLSVVLCHWESLNTMDDFP